MALLTDIETALKAEIKSIFGLTMKKVDSFAGALDEGQTRKLLAITPSIAFSFIAAPIDKGDMKTQWAIYTFNSGSKSEDMRHGTGNLIGAYDALDRLISALDDKTIENIGTIKLKEVRNLYSAAKESKGVAIYGLIIEIGTSTPDLSDANSLDDFLKFEGKYSVDGSPEVTDLLEVQSNA